MNIKFYFIFPYFVDFLFSPDQGKIFCMFYALTSVPFFNFLLGKICESVRVFLFSKENGALSEREKNRVHYFNV